MKSFQSYQKQLFQQVQAAVTPAISEAIENAFFDTPRHHFVDKMLDHNEAKEIIEISITAENLSTYLSQLYGNHPLGLATDEKGVVVSSISQPSAVLSMLQKLDIRVGQRVLEIGTASGWNAAMMSKLVGDTGAIHSIEIISDLAKRAKTKMEKYNCPNVHTYDGDGAINTYSQTFDRIMFTVGAYDIPKLIPEKLKENGLLLMVLKTRGIFDSMILLAKRGDSLVSVDCEACKFVPLKGQYAMPKLDAIKLASVSIWDKVKDKTIQKQFFWWGNKSTNARTKMIKLIGITSFLGIIEPQFQLFQREDNEISFGLIDEASTSVVVWANNQLIAYGNDKAFNQLKAAFQLYFDLGMPSANCFHLKVYPIQERITLSENEWLVERRDSQFLWSLKG